MNNYLNEFINSRKQQIHSIKSEIDFLRVIYEYNLQKGGAANSNKLTSLDHSLNIINKRYSILVRSFVETINKYIETPFEVELLTRKIDTDKLSDFKKSELIVEIKEKDEQINNMTKVIKKMHIQLEQIQPKTQNDSDAAEICIDLLKSPNFLKLPTFKQLEISCYNRISESEWQNKFSEADFLTLLYFKVDSLIFLTIQNELVPSEKEDSKNSNQPKDVEYESKLELYNGYKNFLRKRSNEIIELSKNQIKNNIKDNTSMEIANKNRVVLVKTKFISKLKWNDSFEILKKLFKNLYDNGFTNEISDENLLDHFYIKLLSTKQNPKVDVIKINKIDWSEDLPTLAFFIDRLIVLGNLEYNREVKPYIFYSQHFCKDGVEISNKSLSNAFKVMYEIKPQVNNSSYNDIKAAIDDGLNIHF